ncbi:MAG: hypothetical protein PUF37_07765 [Prevotellaceae bacterium]|nr:hypothetical protein [Prevotellaceae bacterium]
MTVLLRSLHNNRGIDLSPELKSLLYQNGMEADVTMQGSDFVLTTQSFNAASPRTYKISQQQVAAMSDGGSSVANKIAYNTFVGIVGKDYNVPRSYVDARNMGSPVDMGQYGKVVSPGEFGYRTPPYHPHVPYRPIGGFFGKVLGAIQGVAAVASAIAMPPSVYESGPMYRRINGRAVYADPYGSRVADRPNNYLKPGELATGGGGFYDKDEDSRTARKDVTSNIQIGNVQAMDTKPTPIVRPTTGIITYDKFKQELHSKQKDPAELFRRMLASHGVVIERTPEKTIKGEKYTGRLIIQSDGQWKDYAYDLKKSEMDRLLSEHFYARKDKHGHVIRGNADNLNARLDVINDVIKNDWDTKITKDMLNQNSYIKLQMKPELAASELKDWQVKHGINPAAATGGQQQGKTDVVNLKGMREDFKTGYIDRWNTIGVVDGRTLDKDKGFYVDQNGGRRVTVGEIIATPYADSDTRKMGYRMMAVVNNEVMTKEMSAKDYAAFINYDDEYRLKMFDKYFDDIKIKSVHSNSKLEDPVYSGNIQQAKDVAKLDRHYSFVGDDGYRAYITGAMAYKDNMTGHYMMALRTDKDAGMWTKQISAEDFEKFRKASDNDKAFMIQKLFKVSEGGNPDNKLRVVEDIKLPLSVAEKEIQKNLSDKEIQSRAVEFAKNGVDDYLKTHAGQAEQLHKDAATILSGKYNVETAKELEKKYPGLNVTPLTEAGKHAVVGSELRQIREGKASLEDLRQQTRLYLTGDAKVSGKDVDNPDVVKHQNKMWTRSGEHGRDTTIGDIVVNKVKDAEGKEVKGKYTMTAVIDGTTYTHDISQAQYDKFLTTDNLHRMKLFDKIFPEVEMKTKPGMGSNVGAAILGAVAAIGTAVGVAALMKDRPKPEFYGSAQGTIITAPGVPGGDLATVSHSIFESEMEIEEGRAMAQDRGMGI